MSDAFSSLFVVCSAGRMVPHWRLFLVLFACLVPAGCSSSTSTDSGPAEEESGDQAATAAVVSLESCLAELQPDEFGIHVPVDLPLSSLNEWAEVDLADRLNPLVDEELLREDLSLLLDDDLVERVLRRRFVTRDATHTRDAIWAQQAVSNLRTREKSTASRVTALFYYAVHTVRLVPESASGLPLGPFETAFFGEGTVADRAWIFGTLLNELRIPAVVIRLPDSDGQPAPVRLVGALLDGQLYLFDVLLGLPIPPGEVSEDAAALPQQAATLTQVLENDGLLRQFDTGAQPYPVTAESLRQARLEIIGDTTLWSRRMEGLSEALTGDQSVALYRPLVSAGDQDGTFDSIRDAVGGLIPAERIGVWLWPEGRRESRATMSPDQVQQLSELKRAFQTPLPITQIGPDLIVVADRVRVPQLAVGTGWRYLLNARIRQLQGRTADAISLYTKIQSYALLPPTADPTVLQSLPDAIAAQFGSGDAAVKNQLALGLPDNVRLAHQQAGEAAQFWRATCQLEKRDWQPAARDFDLYLRNPANRRFAAAARFLGAIAEAGHGQRRRAVAFLKSIPSAAPEYAAAQFLIRRWSEPRS